MNDITLDQVLDRARMTNTLDASFSGCNALHLSIPLRLAQNSYLSPKGELPIVSKCGLKCSKIPVNTCKPGSGLNFSKCKGTMQFQLFRSGAARC